MRVFQLPIVSLLLLAASPLNAQRLCLASMPPVQLRNASWSSSSIAISMPAI